MDKRGFASMDPQLQQHIASMGGIAAQRMGKAHRFTSEEGKLAGQKGGKARAANALKKYGLPS